jgi:hypothetical protein
MSATSLHTATTTAKPSRPPAFSWTRRALIRLEARHDNWMRRELDAAQTARAHRREIGGDFTIAP